MAPTTDQSLHSTLATLAMFALWGMVIAFLVGRLGRSRPGFAIGLPAGLAFGMRVVAAGLISLTPVAHDLRGGDELGFLGKANLIANTSPGSGEWTHALLRELHVFVLAVQRYVLDSPELAMRVTQVGIAVVGLVLLAAAVYELAGARASVLAMWLLAFEPASIFFSSLLHKEANMMLAIGLVALGGTMVWKRGEPRYLVAVVAGCLIAVATRHYAGWFLIAAGAAILLHAGLRAENRAKIGSLGLVALVVLFAAIAAPTVLNASTNESLQKHLQGSQEANATDNSNLSLEQVDFSTRGAIVRNLPKPGPRRPAAPLPLAAREHQPGPWPARHGGGLPRALLPDQAWDPEPWAHHGPCRTPRIPDLLPAHRLLAQLGERRHVVPLPGADRLALHLPHRRSLEARRAAASRRGRTGGHRVGAAGVSARPGVSYASRSPSSQGGVTPSSSRSRRPSSR